MDRTDALCEKCHAQERAAFYRAGWKIHIKCDATLAGAKSPHSSRSAAPPRTPDNLHRSNWNGSRPVKYFSPRRRRKWWSFFYNCLSVRRRLFPSSTFCDTRAPENGISRRREINIHQFYSSFESALRDKIYFGFPRHITSACAIVPEWRHFTFAGESLTGDSSLLRGKFDYGRRRGRDGFISLGSLFALFRPSIYGRAPY